MRDKGDFAVGLVVGGLVGALIGLLLAPSTGDELRRNLGRQASTTADSVRSGALRVSNTARQQAQVAGQRVRQQVEALLGGIQETVEDAVADLLPEEAAASTDGAGDPA